jgi:transposase
VFKVREDRRPQGRKKLRAERQAYLDLVAQGVSTSEACRLVGVNRNTGHRWRYGTPELAKAGRQQARLAAARPSAVSGRFLSQDERVVIADRLREGAGVSDGLCT